MIEVDVSQLDRVGRALEAIPGAAPKAIARALNRAAESARAAATRKITERYAAKARDVRGMIKLSTASPDDLSVTITARSPALSMGYFPHRPSKPGTGGPGRPALKAEIKRGSKKDVAGAFVARLNSGDRIMRRTGQKTASGKAAIESVYTIPLASMLGVTDVREAVEQAALATLDKRLDHEMHRALGGNS